MYDLEVGSTLPINEQSQKNDVLMLSKSLENNPYIKGREATKEILLAFGKADPEKFLKPEGQVEKEHAQQIQEHIQTEMALDAPKHQTDLAKTEMKTDTAKKVAIIKAATEHAGNVIQDESARRETKGKVLASMLKMSAQRGQR
jgi:hypothetical protein